MTAPGSPASCSARSARSNVRCGWRVGNPRVAAACGDRAPAQAGHSQVGAVRTVLGRGAQAHGFEADLWTLERVGEVVARVTGVVLSRASVWRLLTGRLGWSPQRPERRAVEWDEWEIARWVAHEWPRIKKAGEHTCLDRVPRRIRRLARAAVVAPTRPEDGLRSFGTA
ncbi:winged helix-turn-helix domain-containing protein [Streptomyces sp. NPDC007172]|uniref:helix-turn-helix domain-containing protein n=1 Tax=Streptomyces sp. NPDC007172 TaxID=3364776 RepID=UPI0036C084B0